MSKAPTAAPVLKDGKLVKRCPSCGVFKELLPNFYKNKRTRDGWSSWCKSCCSKKARNERRLYKSQGLCHCGKSPEPGRKTCRDCREWYESRLQGKAEHREHLRKYHLELKIAALNAYGGCRCTCCGEEHIEFLTIDHSNGDGAKHRREQGTSSTLYSWLKKHGYPPGFGVLCMNCNCARGLFGVCPHQIDPKERARDLAKFEELQRERRIRMRETRIRRRLERAQEATK